MSQALVQRHYQLDNLNFRDFWDVCSHFQHTHEDYKHVAYTLEGAHGLIAADEWDVSVVLKKISSSRDQPRMFLAKFYRTEIDFDRDHSDARLTYFTESVGSMAAGLHYYNETSTKLSVYNFENILYTNYELLNFLPEPESGFGTPCEVLAVVIDMRGFSTFCEQPNIESPYTCGLMTAFYNMVSHAFIRFPPDMIKFLGDGVLALWQTTPEDRAVAIEVCMDGIGSLNRRWADIRRAPQFTHGAPKDIGSGLSFGLASKLSVGNDYIGRPINLASRLCGVCQPGQALIDKAVPGITADPHTKEVKVRIKSFGDYQAWSILIT
ncbi:MAG: adenylate/guanylate cyclase domain-containing protein [Verrucomicrobiota bacterium]|nr:adenylate/guanylate cyclase domain-containing protein [Verrucomicrobiota bacterium]